MAIFNGLFTLILVYGYPVIAVAVFLGSAGFPLPGIAVVLAAGSLAATENLNLVILFLLVTFCCVLGDVVDYFLGKKIGEVVLSKLCKDSKFAQRFLTTAQKYFLKWPGLSIFLSRWLFPPAGTLISIVAGISQYPLRKFLFFDVAGDAVFAFLFLSLGYFFSENWTAIWQYFNGPPRIVIGLVFGLILISMGMRKITRRSTRTAKRR